MDYICNTPACKFWSEGGCKKETAITIQEHCCMAYDACSVDDHQRTSPESLHFGSFKGLDDWMAYKREREAKDERIRLLELKLTLSEKKHSRYGRLFPILILVVYGLGVLAGCLQS